MKQKLILFFLLAILLVNTGCTRIKRLFPVKRITVNTSSFHPSFSTGPCQVELPIGLARGVNVECGFINVLEDRQAGKSPVDQLSVLILKGSSTPYADPIIFIADGPDFPIHYYFDVTSSVFFELSKLTNRDVILFNIRGGGDGLPYLDCYKEIPKTRLDPAYLWQKDCANRMTKEGFFVSNFNITEFAKDIEDIRLALRYETLNLWANGAGTSLAIKYAELYPQNLRTMLLESVQTVYSTIGMPAGLSGAIQRLLESCAKDATCTTTFNNLDEEYAAVVDMLKTAPTQTIAGQLTIEKFYQDLQAMLHQSSGSSLAPLYIHAIYVNDLNMINSIIMQYRLQNWVEEPSLPMSSFLRDTAYCSNIIPEPLATEYFTAINSTTSNEIIQSFGKERPIHESACTYWDLPPQDYSAGGRVPSEVPTLLVAGMFDPITGLESAQFAASVLPNSQVIAVAGYGKDPIVSGQICALPVLEQFFNNGYVADFGCLGNTAVNYPTVLAAYEPPASVSYNYFNDYNTMVKGFLPENWVEDGTGIGRRLAFTGDITSIEYHYGRGTSSQALLPAYLTSIGVKELPQEYTNMTDSHGVAWKIYHASQSTQDYTIVYSIAMADLQQGGAIIGLKSSHFEYFDLLTKVLFPAINEFQYR